MQDSPLYYEVIYPSQAERNDSFLQAFGFKHGSNKRRERRERKGYRNGD